MAMERGDRKASRSDEVMGGFRLSNALAHCDPAATPCGQPGLAAKDTRRPFIGQSEFSEALISLDYLFNRRRPGVCQPSALASAKSRKLSTAGERNWRPRTNSAMRQVTVGWHSGRNTRPKPSTRGRAMDGQITYPGCTRSRARAVLTRWTGTMRRG